jgi:hypothetical protein
MRILPLINTKSNTSFSVLLLPSELEHKTIGVQSTMQISTICYMQPSYIAEQSGDLQQTIDLFNVQNQYFCDYVRAVEPFCDTDATENHAWRVAFTMVGGETAHLHPFGANVLRVFKLGGLMDAQSIQDGCARWATILDIRTAGMGASDDGLVSSRPPLPHLPHAKSVITLVVAAPHMP